MKKEKSQEDKWGSENEFANIIFTVPLRKRDTLNLELYNYSVVPEMGQRTLREL